MTARQLFIAGILTEICYLSLYAFRSPLDGVVAFIAVNAAATLILAWLLVRRGEGNTPGNLLRHVIGFAILFRLTLVPLDPVCSDDIYRYLWDGRVALSGENPFAYPPDDPRLAHLATADLPAKVNFHSMGTVYPSVAQAFFLLSAFIFGPSLPGLKLLLILCDALTIVLILNLLRERHRDLNLVLIYAWSPVPVMYIALEGHIDALGIPLMLLVILYAGRLRPVRASLALAGAALVKVFPLIIAPFFVALRDDWRRFLLPAIPALIFAAGCFFFLPPSGILLDSLLTFGRSWEFNGSVFTVLYAVIGSNEAAHAACLLLLAVWLALVARMQRSFTEKVFLGVLGYLLISPIAHPWYFTWLAALLPLRWSTAAFVLLGMTNLSNIVVYRYHQSGVWRDDPLIVACEYLPVALLLVMEMRGKDILRIA